MTRISTIRSSATIIGVGTGYSNDPVTPILKKYKGRQRSSSARRWVSEEEKTI